MAKWKKWSDMSKVEKIIGLLVAVAIVIIFISVVSGNDDPEKNQSDTSTAKPIAFTQVEEKDISYQGCKRVSYKIKVADDAEKDAVKATEQKIIDDHKSSWDDITVFTYKQSDTDDFVKNNGFTVDKSEYSTCK